MYPRATGHCYSHHIPADVITPEDVNETSFTDEELLRALQYLRTTDADLVKGDLVIFDATEGYRNTGVTIFDGTNVIDLSDEPDEYGTLPKAFRVIEDGVPITYWQDINQTNEGRGITHNSIVWFDHSKVLQQCLSNCNIGLIRNDGDEDEPEMLHTTFYYGGQKYFIILDEIDNIPTLDNFRTRLSDLTDLLVFEYEAENAEGVLNALFLKE